MDGGWDKVMQSESGAALKLSMAQFGFVTKPITWQ